MKRIISLMLSMFMILSLLIFQVKAEEVGVTPSETDYQVSGSMITGLKREYLNTLDSYQKQNIKLIIPNNIDGNMITGIGKNAFKFDVLQNGRFILLDLSLMTSLKTIDEYAFYNNNLMAGKIILPSTIERISAHAFEGCSSLTGDLILPNSLKTLGSYVFSGCKGMKGKLALSNQLKEVPNYSFKDAGFTGTLDIPSSIEKICDSAFRQGNSYKGFSGRLIIPDSVKVVENVAFSYQDSITDVQFSKNMTTIPTSMFRYCKGLAGVLEIPDHIQSIGTNAFSDTNLKTIYLPTMKDHNNTEFIMDSPFYNCVNLTTIICKENDYAIIKPLLKKYSSVQNKLSYEKEISLHDGNNSSYVPLLKLYNFSYQYVKQNDKSWKLDKQYKFPFITGNSDGKMKWSTSKESKTPVYETTIVGQEKSLYTIEALETPVITISEGIDKIYDGKSARLAVNATHPKYVDIEHAGEGDVVFYYTWKWATIGSSPAIQAGFDLNTLDLTEVYNPSYTITCQVTVQACYVEKNVAKQFYSVKKEFGVHIKQAPSIVSPIYNDTIQYKDGLPDISLTHGDTKGTISWDVDQILKEGTHSYKWTFIPESNLVGSSNYTIVKGTSEITAYHAKIFDIIIKDNGHGQISPSYYYQVTQGEKTSLTIKPDSEYFVSSLKINGKESLSQLINNILSIENVQSNYTIEIKYEKKNLHNVEQIINNLPQISDNQRPTQEQIASILEAKLSYENLGSLKDDVSKEIKKEFNDLLMKLPQIEIETKNQLVDSSLLLDNMSIEDIEVLLNDPQATLSIQCDMNTIINETVENDLKEYTNDLTIANCFDIELTKIISSKGNQTISTLSSLRTPIQLVLNIPTHLPPINKNHYRKYYVVRIHEESGHKEITILDNESTEDNIVVSTDKFSLYAIAYKDIENTDHVDTPNIINPNNPTTVKPDGSKNSNHLIVTSDEQNVTLWIVLGFVSLVFAIVLVYSKKKK